MTPSISDEEQEELLRLAGALNDEATAHRAATSSLVGGQRAREAAEADFKDGCATILLRLLARSAPEEGVAEEALHRAEAAFLVSLAQHGIPADVQGLLVGGDERGSVAPGALRKALRNALTPQEGPATFQARVRPWMTECFGPTIPFDKVERGDRLLEEVFELLQSGGYDPARVVALRDYVWARPVGDPPQEVGGVMVTLAAYCNAFDLDMHEAGETELARINRSEIIEKIRAKQAAKPTGSALPVAQEGPAARSSGQGGVDNLDNARLVTRLIHDHVKYVPHPWDIAREGSLTGVPDAAVAILKALASAHDSAGLRAAFSDLIYRKRHVLTAPDLADELLSLLPVGVGGAEGLEEALRLAEIGEYLFDRAHRYGDGQTDPREFCISWDWQQSKPNEFGEGILLAEAVKWHEGLREDGVLSEAYKLRAALGCLPPPPVGALDGEGK